MVVVEDGQVRAAWARRIRRLLAVGFWSEPGQQESDRHRPAPPPATNAAACPRPSSTAPTPPKDDGHGGVECVDGGGAEPTRSSGAEPVCGSEGDQVGGHHTDGYRYAVAGQQPGQHAAIKDQGRVDQDRRAIPGVPSPRPPGGPRMSTGTTTERAPGIRSASHRPRRRLNTSSAAAMIVVGHRMAATSKSPACVEHQVVVDDPAWSLTERLGGSIAKHQPDVQRQALAARQWVDTALAARVLDVEDVVLGSVDHREAASFPFPLSPSGKSRSGDRRDIIRRGSSTSSVSPINPRSADAGVR